MRRNQLLIFVRAAAGLLLGLALWAALAIPYNTFLCRVTEPLIRAFERPAVTRLLPRGSELTIDRADLRRGPARPAVATSVLTVNIVLLTSLFLANHQPLRTANVARLLTASVALIPIHVAAIIVNVQATYALSLGPWSARNYNAFERNLWGAAAHFYLIIGGFAAAFLLWWLLRPSVEGAVSASRRRRPGRSSRR